MEPHPIKERHPVAWRCFLLGAILIAGLVLALLWMFNPAEEAFVPDCPFKSVTGLMCPGCGSLRAIHSLLHLNIRDALHYNPVGTLLLPVLLVACSMQLLQELLRTHLWQARLPGRAILVLLSVWWVVRNTSLFPDV